MIDAAMLSRRLFYALRHYLIAAFDAMPLAATLLCCLRVILFADDTFRLMLLPLR